MPKSGSDLRQKVFYAEFRFIWNWGCPPLCRGPAPSSTKGKHIKVRSCAVHSLIFLPTPTPLRCLPSFPTWLELSRTSTRLVSLLQSVSQSSSIFLSTRFASTSTIPPLIVSSSTMGSLKRCCVVLHSSSNLSQSGNCCRKVTRFLELLEQRFYLGLWTRHTGIFFFFLFLPNA